VPAAFVPGRPETPASVPWAAGLLVSGGAAGGLRVSLPVPEYLFAMKRMAMRPEGVEGSHDIADIEALAAICQLRGAEDALRLVEAFYPAARVPAKVRFGVEEIMERVAKGAAGGASM
jgi:hypothetical protein